MQIQQQNSLFRKLYQAQVKQILEFPVQVSCKFKISFSNQGQQNQKNYSQQRIFHIRSNYMLEWDEIRQIYVKGFQFSHNIKLKQFVHVPLINQQYQEQNQNIAKSFIVQVAPNFIQNHQSNIFSANNILFEDCDPEYNKYYRFIQNLLKKPLVAQINNLRQYYKPQKIVINQTYFKVFQAVQTRSQKKVLIKSYPFQMIVDRNSLKIIKNQLLVISKLDSPYIQKLLRTYWTNNSLYLTFQPNDGRLSDILNFKNQLNWDLEKLQKLGFQLLSALVQIHEKGIIHGSIQANNILFKDINSINLKFVIFNFENSRLVVKSDNSVKNPQIGSFQISYMRDILQKQKIVDINGLARCLKSVSQKTFQKLKNKEVQEQQAQGLEKQLNQAYCQFQLLLQKMMDLNKKNCISASEALNHKFFKLKFTH